MSCELYEGDCLEIMKDLPDNSVDLILADLPYQTTRNSWDCNIPLDRLWEQYKRIVKKRGCIALFAQSPYDKILALSNIDDFKYEWIWEKPMATGMLNCNFAPMKAHETILIFSQSAASFVKDKSKAMIYIPQMDTGKPYTATSGHASTNYDSKNMKTTTTINNGTRYPRDVIKFSKDKEKYHPTQKPVALLEYLIKTYTLGGGYSIG